MLSHTVGKVIGGMKPCQAAQDLGIPKDHWNVGWPFTVLGSGLQIKVVTASQPLGALEESSSLSPYSNRAIQSEDSPASCHKRVIRCQSPIHTATINPRPDGVFPDPTCRCGAPRAICQAPGPILDPKTPVDSFGTELSEYVAKNLSEDVTCRVKGIFFFYLSLLASSGKAAVSN